MKFNDRDDIIQLTPLWKGERFDDGRPRVPDDILTRMERVTTEEAWSVLWREGYENQFVSGWTRLPATKRLVGRAVTGAFIPMRPDLHGTLMDLGNNKEGRIGEMNSWVIETLIEDDVIVIDLFDKVWMGTYSGANLSTAIASRTKRGQVIWGGIRDAEQIVDIPNLDTFCRGIDPTAIRDVTLTGINIPCRIGTATVMPGDIVLGTMTGILFIPPHLAEAAVDHSERTNMRELFSHQRLREGIYNSSEMDTKWTDAIEADFASWRKEKGLDDGTIDWSKPELGAASDDEETLLG